MSDAFEPTTEYPPAIPETGNEFVSPGPLSRPLSDYLAMCAPRSPRASRANRVRNHADLVPPDLVPRPSPDLMPAGIGSVN